MFREVLQLKLFTAAILVVLGFFAVSIMKLEPPLAAVRKELKNLDQKIDETKKNSLELEKLGEYLKSDAYLERQARLKLNYKKPDEKVVYVYQKITETRNERGIQKDSGLNKILESKTLTNLKKWWGYFIGE